MKKFPPRRRLWPAAALLCLLALPLLLPRLSGGRLSRIKQLLPAESNQYCTRFAGVRTWLSCS